MRVMRSGIQTVLLAAALAVVGCESPQPTRPVRIDCGEEYFDFLANYFPSFVTWMSIREDGELRGLLLRDGDIVAGSEDQTVFQYVASDGPVLHVTSDEWSTRLSGKIVSLSLGSDSARQWLKSASERDLAGIRLVSTPDSLEEASLLALKRLAAVNPNVGLACESWTALDQVLPLFQPRVLFLGGSEPDFRRGVANLRKLETLAISASDSASLDFLPALPRLRRCLLNNWDTEEAGPLPVGIKGLKSLVVNQGGAMKDLSPLRAAPAGLEELSLLSMDEPLDLTHIANFPALRTLVLNGSEVSKGLSGLAGLKKLQRVGVPTNITQAQFATLVATHPDLRVLEIVGADSLTDLSPLHGLKRLWGLVLDSPNVNVEAVKGLRSLRFLGLGGRDATQASRDQFASIKKALPDALVVSVGPFCLGSGWILLLMPVSAFFWFLGSLSRKPRAADERSS